MSDRFKEWEAPLIEHGKMTKWNWMVHHPENLNLGIKTDIGAFTYINALEGVEIGDNVQVGSHTSIYSVSTIDSKAGQVTVGENSCIGSHSTIMPGVKIGKNSVVGAHSFVIEDIPDNAVAFGVPAKVQKRK